MPLRRWKKKEVMVLTGAQSYGPDYGGEVRLLHHDGDKEEYVWNIGNPLGYLLVLPCYD